MSKKIYAVKNGRVPGIYLNWEECKAQVDGYSGAIYKSFSNTDDALEYIGVVKNKEAPECEVKVYVDGSYDVRTGDYSYGMVVLLSDGTTYQTYRAFSHDNEASSMRNVTGEIEGAKAAIDYAILHGYKSLAIYYDYEGIERWCTGEWHCNKKATKQYKEFYDKAIKSLVIHFIKVKGHSGNRYNEIADKLAKAALGLC
ncbi:MAG: viroplasmin family protein [Blautia sp.]